MKINLNHAVALTLGLVTGAMSFTSCTNDLEVDRNTDPAGNAITFATSVGHTTRATETKLENLGNFAVVARGMHHDGVLYDSYLIGDPATGGEIAKREGSTSTWKLSRNVYWPATLNKVLFYAYTTLKGTDGDNAVLGEGPTFGFDGNNPFINNFKPQKATEATNEIQADGKDQKDLLIAYKDQEKSKSETKVILNFRHALTQVSIKAKQDGKLDNDNRIVKIKGAWIVNAAESGKLTATASSTGSDENTEYTYAESWTPSGQAAYGSVWKDPVRLDKTNSSDLLREMSLMLIPQDLEAWDTNEADNGSKGAYILLLCRVELEHPGDSHEGVDITDIGTANGKHYHQLFPVNTEVYDAAEYGFVCMPLSSSWNTEGIGKHYTYNLNICGDGTGAGKYPPAEEANTFKDTLVPSSMGIKVVLNNPEVTGKNPGDNVLDEPIQFTVTVDGWATTGDWIPGDTDF